MAEIINISNVTDLSGNPPIITPSNPVTTVINDPPAPPCKPCYYYCCDCTCRCDCCCYRRSCCRCCDCCRHCCCRCR